MQGKGASSFRATYRKGRGGGLFKRHCQYPSSEGRGGMGMQILRSKGGAGHEGERLERKRKEVHPTKQKEKGIQHAKMKKPAEQGE